MAKRYKTSVLGMYLGQFLTIVACDAKSVRVLLLHPDLQGRVDGFVPRLRSLGDLLGKTILNFKFINIHTNLFIYTDSCFMKIMHLFLLDFITLI